MRQDASNERIVSLSMAPTACRSFAILWIASSAPLLARGLDCRGDVLSIFCTSALAGLVRTLVFMANLYKTARLDCCRKHLRSQSGKRFCNTLEVIQLHAVKAFLVAFLK